MEQDPAAPSRTAGTGDPLTRASGITWPGLFLDLTQFSTTISANGAGTVGSYSVDASLTGTSPVLTFDSNGLRLTAGTTGALAWDLTELDPNWDGSLGGLCILEVDQYDKTAHIIMTNAFSATTYQWAGGFRAAIGSGRAIQKWNNAWQPDVNGGTGRTAANSDLVAVENAGRATLTGIHNSLTLPDPLRLDRFDEHQEHPFSDVQYGTVTNLLFAAGHPWVSSIISLENGAATAGYITGMYCLDYARHPGGITYDFEAA